MKYMAGDLLKSIGEPPISIDVFEDRRERYFAVKEVEKHKYDSSPYYQQYFYKVSEFYPYKGVWRLGVDCFGVLCTQVDEKWEKISHLELMLKTGITYKGVANVASR